MGDMLSKGLIMVIGMLLTFSLHSSVVDAQGLFQCATRNDFADFPDGGFARVTEGCWHNTEQHRNHRCGNKRKFDYYFDKQMLLLLNPNNSTSTAFFTLLALKLFNFQQLAPNSKLKIKLDNLKWVYSYCSLHLNYFNSTMNVSNHIGY